MASSFENAREEVAPSLPDAAERGASASRPEARKPDERFPGELRLTARRQYREVYSRGLRAGSPSFTLFGQTNDIGHSRLGLTVTRRFGSAVLRNRAKRVLRELFRRNRRAIPLSMDVIVNVRASMQRLPTANVEREFLETIAVLARRLRR